MAYMNKYNIIHESQSGFRQKHSCQTALIKLIDQWMAGIDKGDTVGSMFVDFRKAFDLVDHKILIQKLAAYKLSMNLFVGLFHILNHVNKQYNMIEEWPLTQIYNRVSHRDQYWDRRYFSYL